MDQLERDSKHVSLWADIDQEDQALRNKAREVCKGLRMVRVDSYDVVSWWLIIGALSLRYLGTSKRLPVVPSCSCWQLYFSNIAVMKKSKVIQNL
jgi:hypothetical protein